MTSYPLLTLFFLFATFISYQELSAHKSSASSFVREKRQFSFNDFFDDALDSLSDAIDDGVDDILDGLGLDNETIDDVKNAVDDVIGNIDESLPDGLDDLPTNVGAATGNTGVGDVTDELDNLIDSLMGEELSINDIVDLITMAIGNTTTDDVDDAFDDVINTLSDYLQDATDIDVLFESTTLGDMREALNSIWALVDSEDPLQIPELPQGVGEVLADLTISEILTVVDDVLVSLIPSNEVYMPEVGFENGTHSQNLYMIAKIVQSIQKINQAINNFTYTRVTDTLNKNGFNVTFNSDRKFMGMIPSVVSMVRSKLEEIRNAVTSELSSMFEKIFSVRRTDPITMVDKADRQVDGDTDDIPTFEEPIADSRETRLIGQLLARFNQIRATVKDFTDNRQIRNATSRIGSRFNGRLPTIVTTIQNRLSETQTAVEKRIREVFTTIVSNARSRDNQFLERLFGNKTDEEISEAVTENLKDVIPLLIRVSVGQATVNDVKCILVDNRLKNRLEGMFQNDLTTRIVSNILLTLTSCDAGLNPLGNIQNNVTMVETGVQAMTSLTSSTDFDDIVVVTDIRNTLSSINPLLSLARIFTERLSSLLDRLRALISQRLRSESTTLGNTPTPSTVVPTTREPTTITTTTTTAPTTVTTTTPTTVTIPTEIPTSGTTITMTTKTIPTVTTTSTQDTTPATTIPTMTTTTTTTATTRTTSTTRPTFPNPESGRVLGMLISRVQQLGLAIGNLTQDRLSTALQRLGVNMTSEEGRVLTGAIPNVIDTVQSRINETMLRFESILQGMLDNVISALRSSDSQFIQSVFQNKTDQEITEILTRSLQDLIPLFMKVASGEASLNDFRCVLVDRVMVDRLNDTFQREETAQIVSSLLLTLVNCDARLTTGGNVLTNASKVNTGVQAMTSLTSIREAGDAEPVAFIQDTLSNLSPALSNLAVFNERLSTLLSLLNTLVSQISLTGTTTTTSPPSSMQTTSRSLLSNLLLDSDQDLASSLRNVINLASGQRVDTNIERIVSNVLTSALASTPINEEGARLIGNRLASVIAPVVTDLLNDTLGDSPVQEQIRAFSSLLNGVDLSNPQTLINVLSELNLDNGTLSNLLPPSLTQLLGQGTSGLTSLSTLTAVPQAMAALGRIYTDGYNTSGRCQLERAAVGNAVTSLQPWALYFIDSMGKLGTGLLQGNTYLVGNFDECEAISGTTDKGDVIGGTYVKYKFLVPLPSGFPPMNGMITYQESGLPIVIWGVCLPKGCSQQDAKIIGDGVAAGLSVSPVSAEIITDRDPMGDSAFVVAVFVFGALGLMCLIGTFLDIIVKGQVEASSSARQNSKGQTSNVSEEPLRSPTGERAAGPVMFRDLRLHLGAMETNNTGESQPDDSRNSSKKIGSLMKLFQAFSIYTNAPDIVSARQAPGEITCLHGIRVLSITWVILGHAYFFYPQFGNLSSFVEMSKWWTFHGILNALLAVDSFFVLSGCLVAYLFLRSVKKAGGLKPRHMLLYYTHRYLRLTPLYALAILFYTGVTPYLEHGPFQTTVTDRDVHCRNNWHWNLLYVSNLWDNADICIGWSWYLPNDMQFYLVAPLILIPLALGYKVIGLLVAFLQLACHIVSFTLLQDKYNASATRNAADYFVYIYIKPYARCGPYAVGLALGYLLYKTKCKVALNRMVVMLGWTLSIGAGFAIVYITADNYSTELGALDPQWSQAAMNAYEIACKPVWALCLAWLIFACATGYGGVINSILSWKAWVPLSRLTYGVYLTHVMVMHYFNNNRRTLAYLTKEHVTERYLAVILLSYGLSFFLSLLVETPVRNLTKPKPVAKTRPPTLTQRRRQPTPPPTGSSRRSSKFVTFSGDVSFVKNDYNSLPHTPRSSIRPTAPEAEDDVTLPESLVDETAGQLTTSQNGVVMPEPQDTGNSTAQPESAGLPAGTTNDTHVYPNLGYVMDENDWLSAALGQELDAETRPQEVTTSSTNQPPSPDEPSTSAEA